MQYRFDQIAFNSTAKKKPTDDDKEHYIGLEHLDSDCLSITRWGSDVAPTGEKLLMKKGDILFGKRRAYQRKVGIAPFDGIFSAHGMVLRPNEEVINKDFFPFFISSDQFMERAVRISVGGLSPTINWKDLREQEFELPSLDKQLVLADKLWAAYRLKESYKKLLVATDEMVKSQFIEMFKNLPVNGVIKDLTVGNIASVKKSYSKEDIINYIDISSIDNTTKTIVETSEHLVTKAPSRAQQCVQKGDILVSTVRPINRNIAVIEEDTSHLVASTGFCILRPQEGYKEYLLSIVLSDTYTEKMCDKANGGLYPAVNNSDVLNYGIHIPDEDTAKKVSALYQQSDKSKFVGFKSQFIEMFYNDNFTCEKLKAHIEVIRGVSYKPTDVRDAKDKDSSVILRSNNIFNGLINYDDIVFVDSTRVSEAQELSKGDIVMCGSNGSKNLVGKAAMITEPPLHKTSFGTFCLGIRCKDTIHPMYLSSYFQTSIYRNKIEELGAGSNILNIKPDYINNMEIPVPRIEQQLKFVSIAEQADKSKLLHRKSIKYSKYSL